MRLSGRFGAYGGAYVPEILVPALEQLEAAFLDAQQDPAFHVELEELLTKYAGRQTPLTRCRNLGAGKARIYLKREDLLHGGAHKTNQVLAQALLAKRMGKTRLIAETGAGQHGVATALAGGLTPGNARAASRVGAWALDLCSGVEAAPGRKDPAKLTAFFDALRPETRACA